MATAGVYHTHLSPICELGGLLLFICFLWHLTHRHCGCSGGLAGRGWPLWDGCISSSDAVRAAIGLQATLTCPRDLRSGCSSSSFNTTFFGSWESSIMWKVTLQRVIYCCLNVRTELVNFSEMRTLLFLKKKNN